MPCCRTGAEGASKPDRLSAIGFQLAEARWSELRSERISRTQDHTKLTDS